MRRLVLLATLTLVALSAWLAAQEKPATKEKEEKRATLSDVAFLTGSWEGTAGGAEFDEHWTKAKGGLMLGVGRWVKDGRAISFEYMRIESRKDGLRFVAQPGGKPGTVFRVHRFAKGEVVFANPENSFPKYIRYAKQGDGSLEARIANDPDLAGRGQTFRMKPAD